MADVNVPKLIEVCEYIARHAIKIDGGFHGSSWLFDKLMRFFESEPSEIAIIPIVLNSPLLGVNGKAEIYRNGECFIRKTV